MKEKEIKISIILLIVLAVIIGLAFLISNKDATKPDIKLKGVEIKNKNILLISDKEKKVMIKGLINYLNREKYYECKQIVFYNNTYDKQSNKKYFYALIKGADNSLVEITNMGNYKFEYSYITNQANVDEKSEVTGVTYLQIVNPKEYEKQKKAEEDQKELDKSSSESNSEDTRGFVADPNDVVSE